MMQYVFVYAILMASGETLIAEMEAHDKWKPVRNMQKCLVLAKEQEERLRKSYAMNPDCIFKDVKIDCVRKNFRGKKR